MKKLLLFCGLLALGFVACKDDDDGDDTVVPTPIPTIPVGQYRVVRIEIRDSTNHLLQSITSPQDSAEYFYYNAVGQFTKTVRVHPEYCYDSWTEFEDALGFATYDSTQFFGATNHMVMHFYLGWQSQGFDDSEYMYYYLAKSNYHGADTISCN